MLLAVDPCPSIGQGPTDRCDGPRTDLFRLGERGREDAISRGTEMHTGGTTGRVCNDRPPNYGNLLLRFVLETPRRVDPDLAAEVAVRFQSAPNDQTNATIRAAYEQLERQSDLLFAHLTDPDRPRHRRLRVEFTQCDNPYDSDDELVGRSPHSWGAGNHHERQGSGPPSPLTGLRLRRHVRQISCRPRHRCPCRPAPWLRPKWRIRSLANPRAALPRTCSLATELSAEHSVLWTTATLSDHRATLIAHDLLNRVRSA